MASGSSLLLPVERSSLHGRLPRVAEFFLPSGVDLVGILLECQEGPLQLFMRLGIFNDTIRQAHIAIHASLPKHPCLFALAAGHGPLLWAVFVAEGATTSCQDNVRVAEILKEGWQPECVHATGDDGCGLDHALPLLVIIGPIGFVLLQHVGDALVGGIALHLAETHGADMDATCPYDAGDLGVHESSVTTLSLGAGDRSVTSSVVVEELLGEVPACGGHGSSACNIAVHEECAV